MTRLIQAAEKGRLFKQATRQSVGWSLQRCHVGGESRSAAEPAPRMLLGFGEACGSAGRSSLTCRPAVILAASQPPRGRGHPALKPLPLSGRPVLRPGDIIKSVRRWPGPTLKGTWSFGYTSSGSFETQCYLESTGAPAHQP